MPELPPTSYDDIPYTNNPFHQSHPDRLGTTARLFGMAPAPANRCRVLELGCAAGGNLLPLAQVFPESRFVGIDLSPRQIADGRALTEALGLTNVELRALSILDMDESLGRFDYVLCHGVYSWVPAAVRDKILAVCRANLTPQGVAYVSYNTLPGWHIGGLIRDMLAFHVRKIPEPREQIRQARAFLDFVVGAMPDPDSVQRRVLKEEVDRLHAATDTYLYHEYLEEVNQPLYFHDFMEQAAAHGLQYLAEARGNFPLTAPPAAASAAEAAAELLRREQYFDFSRFRAFRRTLLCHAEVPLDRSVRSGAVTGMYLSAHARPLAPQPDCRSPEVEEFGELDADTKVSVGTPMVKAALLALYEARPSPMSFDALCEEIPKRLGPRPPLSEIERGQLAEVLAHYFLANLVGLYSRPPHFVTEAGERPVAFPVARLQAGQGESRVTNLLHRSYEIGDGHRLVLRSLDGSRDRAALLDALRQARAAGELTLPPDGAPADSQAGGPDDLSRFLETCLADLAQNALLVR